MWGGPADAIARVLGTLPLGCRALLSSMTKTMDSTIQVVKPSGILDSTQAGEFREEIAKRVRAGATTILVDFQDVTFMDSSGLGALVLALKTVRSSGGKMFVCAANDQVKMLFELTSMDRVFVMYEDREAFEATIAG